MSIWHVLEIEETTDTRKIKRAYAKMSKLCHPESEPEKFQELYQAYHRALDYAKENENIEEDFWDDEIIPAENVDFNEINAIEEQAQYPQPKEPETEPNPLFTNSLYANISERVAEGMAAFTEFFMASGRKDWKKFVIQPEFLRVQFDEMFVKLLADFLKQQTKYPVQELPYDLVKELYFCYYPYMEERGEAIFEDSFQELFDILYQNVRIDIVIDRHKSPKAWNEVVKYRVYYKLYASVAATGAQQEIGLWDGYIPELTRRFYVKDGVRTEIDPYNFKLLTFLIEDSPVFPEEIYHYLINKLKFIYPPN